MMIRAKNFAALALMSLALLACSSANEQELKTWMDQQGASARGKIDPIPALRPYEPFTYNAFALIDPFVPRKIEKAGGALAPKGDRRKEALEAFPLEALTMVGTLQRGKATIGLVKSSDNRVFQVRQGNYLGQNHGVITSITDGEISLKELFQDGAGDWAERQSKMMLQEREQKK
jgi:type IV pilus assembly protein PilP